MVPVIVTRAAAALASASPAIGTRVLAYVNRGGRFAFTSVQALGNALTSRPAIAALVVAGLVDAGMSVANIFSPGDEADPAVAAAIAEFGLKTRKVISTDSELSLGSDESAIEFEDLKRIMVWAREQYGSVSAIRSQHNMLRAFCELDDASLERGVRLFLM